MSAVVVFVFVILGLWFACPCSAAEPSSGESAVSTVSTTTTSPAVVIQEQLDNMVQNSQVNGLRKYLAHIRLWARDPKVSYAHFIGEFITFFHFMGFTITTLKELGTSQDELLRLLEIRRKFTPAQERMKAPWADRLVDSCLMGKWK
jgi:hypothetical protein